jgi:hypothetical protein
MIIIVIKKDIKLTFFYNKRPSNKSIKDGSKKPPRHICEYFMGIRELNKSDNEVYHQSIPLVVMVIIIASMIAIYVFGTDYSETGSIAYLILANAFLLVAIVFAKPIVEWRRIEIDNECITIYKLFFKPIRINISQSLYQVVMNKDEIRSYRFRDGKHYTQISPQVYKNGQRLSKRLKKHISQNRLFVEAVN